MIISSMCIISAISFCFIISSQWIRVIYPISPRAASMDPEVITWLPCASKMTQRDFSEIGQYLIITKCKLCAWLFANLHRLISAAIGQWWPLTQPNYHFSLGGKSCALAPLNIISKFPKEKYKFLSEFSSKSNTFVCSICMIAKGYKVFPWKLCQSKNSVCDESPPKRRTVAETFAWRLDYLHVPCEESHLNWKVCLHRSHQWST